MSWLIDDRGVIWFNNSHPIYQWDADDDPIEYAVSALGFVYVEQHNNALMFRFYLAMVRSATMVGVFDLIVRQKRQRIAFTYIVASEYSTEIFGSFSAAFKRGVELLEQHAHHAIPEIVQRRRPFDSRREVSSQTEALISAWWESRRLYTSELFENFTATGLLKTAAILRNPHGSDRLIIDHFGKAIDFLGDRWPQIARGKDIEHQPFGEIARAMAALCRTTVADGMPRLHEVKVALPDA